VFTEEERRVFRYKDAEGREVYGDPLAIHYALLEALQGELNDVLEQARAEDVLARGRAQKRLAGAVVEAFGLEPFDRATGGGATMQDCLDAAGAFLAFLDQKKTPPPSGNSSASSPPTAAGSSPAGPSTSAPTLACG
jgi:hypothetical protein